MPLIALIFLFFATLHAAPCELIIMRHGEAFHNVERVYNSNPQNPNYHPANLTASGRVQVERTAKQLLSKGYNPQTIVAVYISPLPRCVQSAELLIKCGVIREDQVFIDNRLTELDAGNLEGHPSYLPLDESAESHEAVHKRVEDFYRSVIQGECGCAVLVITHNIVIVNLLEEVGERPVRFRTAEARAVSIK